MTANIFVLGLEEHNRATLDRLPRRGEYRFHPLLDIERLRTPGTDLRPLLDEMRAELDAFDGPIDAILGYWDFPVSTLVPVLCRERGLPSASLEAVLKCEHKYWSRLEQSAVVADVPAFTEVPFDSDRPPAGLRYPLWLKPVKSYSSALAFRVTDDAGFRAALARVREGAQQLGEPLAPLLEWVGAPERVARAGGTACLAEEEVAGRQVTVEGYVWRGEPRVYGVVDSVTYPDSPSFLRYQYPSAVPGPVVDQLAEVSRRVVARVGLDSSTFNIEYFWDPATNSVRLLEINPRHSQSHAKLFEMVDGVPNHEAQVRLALGREPERVARGGDYAVATKWFLRRFDDGVVHRAPDEADVARLERDVPGVTVAIRAREGDRLARMRGQDSYSYGLAEVFVGARDIEEAQRAYELCLARLPFRISDDSDAPAEEE